MDTAFFTKPVAMVIFAPRDDITDGWVVIERPSIITHGGVAFVAGFHKADSPVGIRGRRVLIPLHAVTTITEYDTAAEVCDTPKTQRRRRK